ncbi:hypothetical protein H4R35_002641 [Dimargaris xerosporica]|nr:hypothetical protein H4R35_002641 [Dimargaris xerosporica]
MDDTLTQVVKHCGLPLKLYTDCIDANPKDWNRACAQERAALTQCSNQHVTLLKKVKAECRAVIQRYDACVSTHPDDPARCVEALRDLYRCTQNAAGHAPASPPDPHAAAL